MVTPTAARCLRRGEGGPMTCGMPNWELLLECANSLSGGVDRGSSGSDRGGAVDGGGRGCPGDRRSPSTSPTVGRDGAPKPPALAHPDDHGCGRRGGHRCCGASRFRTLTQTVQLPAARRCRRRPAAPRRRGQGRSCPLLRPGPDRQCKVTPTPVSRRGVSLRRSRPSLRRTAVRRPSGPPEATALGQGCAVGLGALRSDDVQLHVDVAAGGVGVRADGVSRFHQRLRLLGVQLGQVALELDC